MDNRESVRVVYLKCFTIGVLWLFFNLEYASQGSEKSHEMSFCISRKDTISKSNLF